MAMPLRKSGAKGALPASDKVLDSRVWHEVPAEGSAVCVGTWIIPSPLERDESHALSATQQQDQTSSQARIPGPDAHPQRAEAHQTQASPGHPSYQRVLTIGPSLESACGVLRLLAYGCLADERGRGVLLRDVVSRKGKWALSCLRDILDERMIVAHAIDTGWPVSVATANGSM